MTGSPTLTNPPSPPSNSSTSPSPSDITDARITEYINTLAQSVRSAGSRKPIFYNGWGGHLGAVGLSTIEGCTFGWYPCGLVAGHALRRNFLPAVADYPGDALPDLAGKAIGVYEFDAADVPGSYLYPAMARAFRCGGAQFAAQFQYDPLPLAPFNKGWQTHYLNLVYAPGRALSFMIAARGLPPVAPTRGAAPLPGQQRLRCGPSRAAAGVSGEL